MQISPSPTDISCVICAFNEEQRISDIVSVARQNPLISEIIVVNDGSTDQTQTLVEGLASKPGTPVRLFNHPHNKGKSAAYSLGVTNASNDLLLFLDADLVGLDVAAITKLIEPVLEKRTDVTISLKKNSLRLYKIINLDYVSGERVFSKSLIVDHLDAIAHLPGYAVETYINELIISKQQRLETVRWSYVSHLRKTDKNGFFLGIYKEVRMLIGITTMFSPYVTLRQICILTRLTNAKKMETNRQ